MTSQMFILFHIYLVCVYVYIFVQCMSMYTLQSGLQYVEVKELLLSLAVPSHHIGSDCFPLLSWRYWKAVFTSLQLFTGQAILLKVWNSTGTEYQLT